MNNFKCVQDEKLNNLGDDNIFFYTNFWKNCVLFLEYSHTDS